MKKLTTAAAALLLCAVSFVNVSAKVKTQEINFREDVRIGDTTVKAGTYRVSFDDQSNELTVVDRKTKAVVAKAAARAGQRITRGSSVEYFTATKGNAQVLTSLSFEGDKRAFTIGETAAADTAK